MKLNLWPKHYNNTQNIAKPVSYQCSPLSPYLGALELQFTHGSFYKFVALSLMVLFQLESLHLDDYNLIYSQNKNRGFLQNFDSISFEYSTFSLFTNTTQPIQINPNQQYKTTSTQSQNSFTTKTKLFLSTFGVFPNSNKRTKGFGFGFFYHFRL